MIANGFFTAARSPGMNVNAGSSDHERCAGDAVSGIVVHHNHVVNIIIKRVPRSDSKRSFSVAVATFCYRVRCISVPRVFTVLGGVPVVTPNAIYVVVAAACPFVNVQPARDSVGIQASYVVVHSQRSVRLIFNCHRARWRDDV